MSANAPSAGEIRDALERALDCTRLRNDAELARLLRFLVERRLTGGAGELQESAIAAEVFDRGPGFDARSDAIVRTQTGNLRDLLAQYYETAGLYEPVRIDLPQCGFAPVFTLRTLPTIVRPEVGPASAPSPWAVDQPPVQRRRLLLLIAAASVILAIGMVALLFKR
jgi:hypothetical protein